MSFEVQEVGGRATNVVSMFRVSVALSNKLQADQKRGVENRNLEKGQKTRPPERMTAGHF